MYVDTAILFCEYLNLHYRCRETVLIISRHLFYLISVFYYF